MRNWLIKFLIRFGLLRFVNFNAHLSIGENLFKIPLLAGTGIANLNISETWMLDILRFIISERKGKFVDVGVNIDQTLIKLKSISPDHWYIGFEPNPHCVTYVSWLIKKNRLINSTILPVGISDSTAMAKLYFTTGSTTNSSASVISGFRDESTIKSSEFIPIFDIDAIEKVVDLSGISILKIDVEGGELEVLKAFYEKIEKDRPFILLEVLPLYNGENELRLKRQEKIEKIINELNYSILRIIKDANNKIAELRMIESMGVHSDLKLCDYILVPDHKVGSFMERFKR